jgi:molybdopterin converting factor small subunit
LKIRVRAYGALRQVLGRRELELELPEGATAADALRAAGLPDRVDVWVLVDGSRAALQAPLSEGAVLDFFQPVGGG